MNIIETKFKVTTGTNIQKSSTQHYTFNKFSDADTFVRKSPEISFKGNLKSAAQKALENPKRAAEFGAAFLAALIALASGQDLDAVNKDKNAYNVDDNLDQAAAEAAKTYVELHKNIPQNSEMLTEDAGIINGTVEEPQVGENKENNLISIEFPKRTKKGMPANHIKALKNAVEDLKINEDLANKLLDICQSIVENESTVDKSKIEEFTTQIETNKDNFEALNNILSTFTINDETNKKTNQVKILGKIELQDGPSTIYTRTISSRNQKDYAEKLCNEITVQPVMNQENKYIFKTKSPHQHLGVNLNAILLKFEERFTNNPKWMHRFPFGNNEVCYILKEINGQDYNNITDNDAEDIVKIIEKNPIFTEFFTLHGALRFIDRYVYTKYQTDTVEELIDKTKNKLNLISEAIKEALMQGVDIETYTDEFQSYGARIILDPNKINILKDAGYCRPIKITVCENQPSPNYYFKSKKEPLINTIF